MKIKNSTNYDPVDLCLVTCNKQYTLATININKREVFVKVHYEEEYRGMEEKFTDEIGATSSHGITDHISFHKDGAVHLTCKKYKGKLHRRIAAHVEGGVFDLPDEEVVPFLFLSFMLNDNDYRLPLRQISQKNHVWRLAERINQRHGCKFVFTPDNAAYVLNGIKDKVILVILTNRVMYPPSDGVERIERHWQGIAAHNFLNISIYPKWERLQDMAGTKIQLTNQRSQPLRHL